MAIAQGIAYLEVGAELVVHFLVAPAVGGLEELQGHQRVDRHVGTRRDVRIQHSQGRFVQTAEAFRSKVSAQEFCTHSRNGSGRSSTWLVNGIGR